MSLWGNCTSFKMLREKSPINLLLLGKISVFRQRELSWKSNDYTPQLKQSFCFGFNETVTQRNNSILKTLRTFYVHHTDIKIHFVVRYVSFYMIRRSFKQVITNCIHSNYSVFFPKRIKRLSILWHVNFIAEKKYFSQKTRFVLDFNQNVNKSTKKILLNLKFNL